MHKSNKPVLCRVLFMLSAVALSGCIDDKYDLSDIDTTTELTVNDLTVPVSLKDIYLEKIIDLDESDPDAIIKIREIDGRRCYVLSKNGDFTAESSNIEKVHAPAPQHIESPTVIISALDALGGLRAAPAYREYTITDYYTNFEYHVGRDGNPAVDDAIKAIQDMTLDQEDPMLVTMDFSSEAIGETASRCELYDFTIYVPETFTAHYGNITSKNGRITIPYITSSDGHLSIQLTVEKIDFVNDEHPQGQEITDGTFNFSERVGVIGGRFLVYPREGMSPADYPAAIDFTTDYDMTKFTVASFSGIIENEVDVNPIDPFDISGLPDFLSGNQTDVCLAEPALVLTVNNPVAAYGLGCETGLTLTALRNGGESGQTETLEKLGFSDISEQTHVLSTGTTIPSWLDVNSSSPVIYTQFAGMGRILSGEGLPQQIRIDMQSQSLPNPVVKGAVRNFPLGEDIDQINGSYEFVSPLALAEGSTIVYTSTEDGWNDEDVDALTITKLSVNATVTTTIPAGAKVYIKPIDIHGNIIPLSNADQAYAAMPAMAENYPLVLELLGDIRHLDGIFIEAIVDDFNGESLTPEQTIVVSGLRATVCGTYNKEL